MLVSVIQDIIPPGSYAGCSRGRLLECSGRSDLCVVASLRGCQVVRRCWTGGGFVLQVFLPWLGVWPPLSCRGGGRGGTVLQCGVAASWQHPLLRESLL